MEQTLPKSKAQSKLMATVKATVMKGVGDVVKAMVSYQNSTLGVFS
jgi:hypothetical protein